MNMKCIKQLPCIASLILIVMVVLFSASVLTNCGDDSSGNSDCDEFNTPAKTEHYGDSCGSFTYGTCPTVFDDCAEGECKSTSNGSVCTRTCSANSDCPSGLSYCVANNSGEKVCAKACASHTYCDGTLCCSYYPDPNDPTQCVQGSCAPPVLK